MKLVTYNKSVWMTWAMFPLFLVIGLLLAVITRSATVVYVWIGAAFSFWFLCVLLILSVRYHWIAIDCPLCGSQTLERFWDSPGNPHCEQCGTLVIKGILNPEVKKAASMCHHCHYDLTGNETGGCPECGTKTGAEYGPPCDEKPEAHVPGNEGH